MLRLHIVRHGQTEWNAIRRVQGQRNSELNDTGRQQAADVRSQIADIDFAAVYVSPLLRTRQTAEILCANRDVEFQYLDNLMEMGLGEWETQMWADVEKQWVDQHAVFTDTPHKFDMRGAETAQQVSDRGQQAIQHITDEITEGDVLVVSHGVLIKTIILHYAQHPLSVLWKEPQLHNCCRSVLQFEPDTTANWLTVADKPVEQVNWAV